MNGPPFPVGSVVTPKELEIKSVSGQITIERNTTGYSVMAFTQSDGEWLVNLRDFGTNHEYFSSFRCSELQFLSELEPA